MSSVKAALEEVGISASLYTGLGSRLRQSPCWYPWLTGSSTQLVGQLSVHMLHSNRKREVVYCGQSTG